MARLNIFSEPGRRVARQYGVGSCPAFLIFDGEGTMIGRQVGLPNTKEIEAVIARGRPQ